MNQMKKLIYVIVLLMIPVILNAKGGKEAGKDLTEINISYVKSPFNLQIMVMKERGMLEQEFAADGISINWYEIASGAKQAEAMAAGSLDIASVMNTASVIITNAAGNKVDIVDIVSRPEETFTIMVMEDGPETVKDLSGRTVAGPKGTVLHQLLAAVEEKEALEDVSFISMGLPQSQAALISGDVDAALLAGSLVIKTQAAGGRVLTSSEGYVTPLLVSASPHSFAEEHKEILQRYQKVQGEAYTFIQEQRDEALAIGARAQGISLEDAENLFERSGMARQFTSADEESLQKDVDFLLSLDMIQSSVDPKQLEAAVLHVQ